MSDSNYWEAFGAVAQLAGAVATFLAVLVSLWLARTANEPKLNFWIHLEQHIDDESDQNIVFHVANMGRVSAQIIAIGWEAGFLWKWRRFAEFDLSHGKTEFPITLDPGQSTSFYLDVPRSVQEIEKHPHIYLLRPLPGIKIPRPIRGLVHIWTGGPVKAKPNKAVWRLLFGKPGVDHGPITLRFNEELRIYGNID